jgi:hypothetical protein
MTGVEPRLPTYLARFYGLGAEASPAKVAEIMEGWRLFRTWSSVLTRVAGDRAGIPLPPQPQFERRPRR